MPDPKPEAPSPKTDPKTEAPGSKQIVEALERFERTQDEAEEALQKHEEAKRVRDRARQDATGLIKAAGLENEVLQVKQKTYRLQGGNLFIQPLKKL